METDGRLLIVGDRGLYYLSGASTITIKLACLNTSQRIPINQGKNVYHWNWYRQ